MKTTIRIIAVLVLALAVFGPHSTAQAGGGLGFRFKGPSAVASFFDASGCINTDVFVIASEAKTQDAPGRPTNLSFASVTIFQYDSCTDTILLNAWGTTNPLPRSALQISSTLDTGTLNTTVNLFDEVSGSNFDVNVNLAWTATGPVNRERFNTYSHTPGCITNSHYQGKSRPAQAIGSVSDGVTNFTPGASIRDTSLSSVNSGTVTIGCN